MYDLYKDYCQEKGQEPVTLSYYRHVFNKYFNLSFNRPHTDTCNTCDKLQKIIEHGLPDANGSTVTERELHHRKVECAKAQIDKAKEGIKTDSSHVAICFDLQKTLPTPVLTCTKVYYSRQLWTYNLCVHNLGSGNAYMFLWHEGQASRGCEEIMSCLLKVYRIIAPKNYTPNCF